MKKILLLLGIILTMANISNCQPPGTNCGFHDTLNLGQLPNPRSCEHTSKLWGTDEEFIPLSQYGEIGIKVNCIFLNKNDGTGNFNFSNPDHVEFVNEFLQVANERYTSIVADQNCYPGSLQHVPDAKIKFLWNIIEINDEYYWNNENCSNNWCCPDRSRWYLNPLDDQIFNDPNISKGINVFFTMDASLFTEIVELEICDARDAYVKVWCSEYPSSQNLEVSSRVHMPDLYSKYVQFNMGEDINDPCVDFADLPTKMWELKDEFGRGLAHELGHSVSLRQDNSCKNALMNGGGSNGFKRNHISPKNVGKIHRALAITNLRQFIDCNQDYHTDNYRAERVVSSDENWDLNIRMYNDVRVKRGESKDTELTLSCQLFMPEDGKIIVERGTRLVIDGQGTPFRYEGSKDEKRSDLKYKRGLVTKAKTCGEEQWWRHIEVWGNPDKIQPYPNYLGILTDDDAGVVYTTNNGMIEEAVVGIRTRNTTSGWQTDKANWGGMIRSDNNSIFYNNRKAVEFMKYDLPNFSKFKDCYFIADEVPDHPNPPYAGITVWDTDNIVVDHCRFKDMTDQGIASIDGGMLVKNACEFSGITEGINYSSSQDLATSHFSVLGGSLGPNLFHDLTFGIKGQGSKRLDVYNNKFYAPGSWGCHINGLSDYVIQQNDFEDITIGNQHEVTGEDLKYTACNTYRNNLSGNVIDGFNAGYEFDNEDFNTTFDMYFSDNLGTPQIFTYQGFTDVPRFNRFTEGRDNHITTPASPTFFYWYPQKASQGDPRYIPLCDLNNLNCNNTSGNFYNIDTEGTNSKCFNTGGRGDGHEGSNNNTAINVQAVSNLSVNVLLLTLANNNSVLSEVERTKLEMEIANKQRITDNYIQNWINDKLKNYEYHLLEEFFNTYPSQKNKRRNIAVQFIKNDIIAVQSLLSTYPIANDDDKAFLLIQEAKVEVLSNGFEFKQSTKDELYSIANSSLGSSGYAKGILGLIDRALFGAEFPDFIQTRESSIESEDKTLHSNSTLIISPNPSNGVINFKSNIENISQIEIFNLGGNSIFKSHASSKLVDLDLNMLLNGIYFPKITLESGIIINKKIILSK